MLPDNEDRSNASLCSLHTIAGAWTSTGGPASSVPGLCGALADRGHSVVLLTGDGQLAPAVQSLTSRVQLVTRPLGPYVLGNYSRSFAAKCRELARDCDLLHTHGLWLHPNFVTSAVGRELEKPVVISPRGMLAPWALQRGKWRKRLAWHVVQRRRLAQAAFIHVTSREEANEVRGAGLSTPIALIPNGLAIRDFPIDQIDSIRRGGRERRVLFLSRVHPKKGVDVLLAAWRIVSHRHPAAHLQIAGPGEPRHLKDLRKSLGAAGLERVEYVGSVDGAVKLETLARATALVLPSHNENYGMVVAESLACGTPVIVSTGVPWEDVETVGCGWRVSTEPEALARAIDEALSAQPGQIDEMGRKGRALVERGHTIEAAASMMEAAYAWACGRARLPDFVEKAS